MKIYHGQGRTKYGPGVQIDLNGDELYYAISAYLTSRGVTIIGPATFSVNDEPLRNAGVYVDPSGKVTKKGKKCWSGDGKEC